MRGNKIMVSNLLKGRHESVVISGTPKPGTFMELVPATNQNAAGMFTYRAVSRADGAKGPVAILTEDDEQGKTHNDAYVSGTVGKIYWPIMGEEMNALLRHQPGTGSLGGDNIGDVLEIDGASGMLQPDSVGSVSTPFVLLEDLTSPQTADRHVWVRYVGNNA